MRTSGSGAKVLGEDVGATTGARFPLPDALEGRFEVRPLRRLVGAMRFEAIPKAGVEALDVFDNRAEMPEPVVGVVVPGDAVRIEEDAGPRTG